MPSRLPFGLRAIVIFVLVFFSAFRSYATHIFGVDLYYTHVAGLTYKINLVMYGDCAGAAFPTFPSSVPVINIYNGATLVTSVNLAIQAPTAGIEVTPVCPADAGLTTCTNTSFTIPGVKKFVYSANVTLTGTSTVWRFLFQGVLGASSAGRSTGITNVTSPGSTIIQLVDTLNNTTFANSNAVYTTIPTPFFCLNEPANFNPGCVDPDGDSLSFHLVPGIDATTGVSVNYATPYTATAPLGVSAGTFSFSNITGQLTFTPNILQKALVVYNVEEFGGGVLRGTSQREMTVVVVACTNTPPSGVMSSPSGGTLSSPTTLDICSNVGAFNFHINPTDPDGNNITMSTAGLPAGSTFSIIGNGTLSPLGTFIWNTTGVTPGTYIFYITYLDDGCPLAGRQTIAYTINVLPIPSEAFALVSPATCVKKAVFTVTPGASASPWTIKIIQAGTTIQTITPVTGMITDSLVPGTYTIRIFNPSNCFVDTIITLVAPPLPIPSVTVAPPLCPGGATGSATIVSLSGLAPYLYAIGGGAYGSSGAFTGLTPGTYTLHIKDANYCIKDTLITVPDAPRILINVSIRRPLCDTFTNGSVTITGYNSVGPYTYALGAGLFSSTNTFTPLGVGTYTFHIKNANGCVVDTTLTLTDSITVHGSLTIAPILCNGGTATVTVTGSSGISPYTYAYNTTPFGSSGVFTVPAGAYTIHVHDVNLCHFDTAITIVQPTAITITPVLTNILCNGAATGVIVVNAVGGTPGYTYNIDGGTYGVSNIFSGLTTGTHTVAVKDVNGCIYTSTVTLTQPTAVKIDSVVMVKPTCNGLSDGIITVWSSGGVAPHSYAVGAGTFGASHTFSGMGAGTYIMHVKDANGCTKDTTVSLLQPAMIVPSAFVTPSLCQTLANGRVTMGATGGTPAYTFALGAGVYGPSGIFTPLAAGTYTFHVKDANGCIKDTIITVTDSLHIHATFTVTPALCFNQASGSIDVTGSGGVSPYVYALGGGTYGTTHLFTSLLAGAFTFHIKDVNGCKNDTTVSLTQPPAIAPNITITEPACNGYTNGSVVIATAGGTAPFNYSWNGGLFSTVSTFTTVAAGSDSISIRDANGCLFDTVITVGQPAKIHFANLVVTDVLCFGGADGTVNVTGTGATPPFSYAVNASAWQAGSFFTGLSAGTITVKIKDNNGCELDTMVDLNQPPALKITSADTTNPTCTGYKDGAVTLHAAGGTPAYTWSDDGTNFGTSASFTALGAGSYTFILKDANGCTADTTITLTGLPEIIVDSTGITEPLCYGSKDGMITVAAGGGVSPFTYKLDAPSTVNTTGIFKSLGSAGYVVTITDSRNCVKDTSLTMRQPDVLTATTTVVPNECKGTDNKGGVLANVTGGTPPYSYAWNTSPPATTVGITGLANGFYTVWIKDANNCSDTVRSEVGYDNCCTPFIPNAFTPNGDGKNDEFRILFKGDMFIVIFSIYNRYGERVYSISNTNDQTLGWDGKFKGVDAELGTYYYYAKIICGNKANHVVELKGDITLVR
jgi:gliding motility-associated-like protein